MLKKCQFLNKICWCKLLKSGRGTFCRPFRKETFCLLTFFRISYLLKKKKTLKLLIFRKMFAILLFSTFWHFSRISESLSESKGKINYNSFIKRKRVSKEKNCPLFLKKCLAPDPKTILNSNLKSISKFFVFLIPNYEIMY